MENVLPQHQIWTYASKIGLFELTAILLACVSILLVLGGIIAFLNVRATAISRAETAASETAEAMAEAVAVKYLEAEMPALLNEYIRLAEDSTSDDDANQIAEAQEKGGHK